jgi:hypothetical protein
MSSFNCFVILFDSTHQALSGEKALKEAGLKHSVVNTPREFSVDCGISLRVGPGLKDTAVSVLEEKGVSYAAVEAYYSRWI